MPSLRSNGRVECAFFLRVFVRKNEKSVARVVVFSKLTRLGNPQSILFCREENKTSPHTSAAQQQQQQSSLSMACTTIPGDDEDWSAARQAFARPALCALIAQHSDLVDTHRLKRVCGAMRAGAGEFLRSKTLPGLVVCGGRSRRGVTSEVWRLDVGKLQWERMSSLTRGRFMHASCVVRGRLVVLGGVYSHLGRGDFGV
jgi:hypothetical protein